MTVDDRRFPRAAQYLATLPQGLASYPMCEARGSLVRSLLSDLPLAAAKDGLPGEILAMVATPPSNSSWISEAKLGLLNLAAADFHGLSDAAFLDRKYQQNRALLGGLVYRALMSVTSPKMLAEVAAFRFPLVHRGGTAMVVSGHTEGSVELRVTYPARLYTRLLAELIGRAFEAALHHSAPKEGRVTLTSFGETEAVFGCRWT
ncbi:MAG: hypothetical protein QM765_10955 [Myxococcales bacterium]